MNYETQWVIYAFKSKLTNVEKLILILVKCVNVYIIIHMIIYAARFNAFLIYLR